MANSGCEVHRFDPSIKSAHIQEGRHLWHHRLSIDWRDPNPAIAAHKLHSNTKKLGTVLNEFGHQKVRKDLGVRFLTAGFGVGKTPDLLSCCLGGPCTFQGLLLVMGFCSAVLVMHIL